MTAEYQTDLAPVGDDTSNNDAKELLDVARAKLGFVPNMYRGMANDPGVLSTYLHGYDLFRGSGQFSPPEQEVVFLTISQANGCGYCVAAHTMLARNVSKLEHEHIEALRAGQALSDPKLEALRQFTHSMWDTRGLPSQSDAEAFKAAGYSDVHIMEIILALAVKTLSNFSNHVNHTELDDVFAEHALAAE